MQTIRETLMARPLPDEIDEALTRLPPFSQYDASQTCFFDIETTGLSAETSSLYLIGCAHLDEGGLRLTQWFANDYVSEKELLASFLAYLADFRLLAHYNGASFDLPYVRSKCTHYGLDASPLDIDSFDLYAHFRSHKRLLPLASLKQKSVEALLGVHREDEMDGGALIRVYSNYMRHKYFRSPEAKDDLRLLLLHNKEDVSGLVLALSLANSLSLLREAPRVDAVRLNADALLLSGTHPYPPSFPILIEPHSKTRGVSLALTPEALTLTIPVTRGKMRYYYPNHRDYYYLPSEGMVVHKSVAAFVDARYREKVDKKSCYAEQSGIFVPALYNDGYKEFFKTYGKKSPYLEWTEELAAHTDFWSLYAASVLSLL